MDEHDDLRSRLRALAAQEIDPALQQAHLARMADVPGHRRLRPKLRAAGVFLAGLLVGGSGLAAAGALPDPAQHAAHQVLGEVGVDIPDPERYHGPECGPERKRNHGGYVRDNKELARSDCGKPLGTGGDGEADVDGRPDHPGGSECQGPPPWAGPGKPSMTKEEKAAAQAARAATCGEDADDPVDDDPVDDGDP